MRKSIRIFPVHLSLFVLDRATYSAILNLLLISFFSGSRTEENRSRRRSQKTSLKQLRDDTGLDSDNKIKELMYYAGPGTVAD